MEFAIYKFVDRSEIGVGETCWIEDFETLQADNKNFNFNMRLLKQELEDDEETAEPPRKRQRVVKSVRQKESATIPVKLEQTDKVVQIQYELPSRCEEEQEESCLNCDQQADTIRKLEKEIERLKTENTSLKSSLLAQNGLPAIVTELKNSIAVLNDIQSQQPLPSLKERTIGSTPTYPVTSPVYMSSLTNITEVSSDPSPEKADVQRIAKNQVAACSRDTNQKFVNDLMTIMFTKEHMATHSITGNKSAKANDVVKPALNKEDVRFIIDQTLKYFQDKRESEVKNNIRIKLNNSSKLFKRKFSVI